MSCNVGSTVCTVVLRLRCHTPRTVLRLIYFTAATVTARSSIAPGRIRIRTVRSPTYRAMHIARVIMYQVSRHAIYLLITSLLRLVLVIR
jgi:hypothetical protein